MAKGSVARKDVAKKGAVKKGAVKKSTKQTSTKAAKVTEVDAILKLAEAIKALADAIAAQKPAVTSLPILPLTTSAKLQVSDIQAIVPGNAVGTHAHPENFSALTEEQILQGIRHIFNNQNLTIKSDLSQLLAQAPLGLAGAVNSFNNGWEPFRVRGLKLDTQDLSEVSTIKGLVRAIARGLQNALPK